MHKRQRTTQGWGVFRSYEDNQLVQFDIAPSTPYVGELFKLAPPHVTGPKCYCEPAMGSAKEKEVEGQPVPVYIHRHRWEETTREDLTEISSANPSTDVGVQSFPHRHKLRNRKQNRSSDGTYDT